MKRLFLMAGIALIAYVIFSAAIEPTASKAASPVYAEISESTVSGEYILTEYDGRVAVMLDGALYIRTEVPVSVLPKADRERLKEGVAFRSLEEMKRALEDYCG